IVAGKVEGGGPVESAIRLGRGRPGLAPLEPGAAYDPGKGVAEGFQWVLGRFMSILPDFDRFGLLAYVARGFDIHWSQVLILDNLLPLLAYLIPWGILAYYLLRFREVANPG